MEIALLNEDKIMPKTRANLEQGYDLQALLANVAVSPDYRYPPGPLYTLSHPVTTFFSPDVALSPIQRLLDLAP